MSIINKKYLKLGKKGPKYPKPLLHSSHTKLHTTQWFKNHNN